MQIARRHVVDLLRTAELGDLAEEAHRVLPDPVEYMHAALGHPLGTLTEAILTGRA